MAKVCRAFESSCKFDHTSGAFMGVEDIVLGFIRWAGCSKADGVSLSFALTFSANKLLSFAARKALRAKLPEVVSPMILAEMPDEVKTGLVHAIQSDEVSHPLPCVLHSSPSLPPSLLGTGCK